MKAIVVTDLMRERPERMVERPKSSSPIRLGLANACPMRANCASRASLNAR